MFAKRLLALGAVALLPACGDEPTPATPDATVDAGTDLGREDTAAPDVAPDTAPADTGAAPAADTGAVACPADDAPSPPDDASADAGPPTPGGYPPLRGPGGPATTFPEDALNRGCAHLYGGPMDRDHHNTVLMLDGYLVMPWAHEAGRGGLSVWTLNDPCRPEHVGTAVEPQMRETHAAGVSFMGGRWMVTTSLRGILFWDIADFRAMRVARDFALPGVTYPDSYRRVVLSTFWQAPYVYVGAADNGVFIVDASDPRAPRLVGTYVPSPAFRVGGVHAIGNLLVVMATEGSRTELLDISDPARPRPIPGGSFLITDGTEVRPGVPRVMPAYFGHVNGNRAYYARHVLGGGLITYDITDPSAPRFVSSYQYQGGPANGGYVFLKEDVAFVGLSNRGVALDLADARSPRVLTEFRMTGDLDTVNPIGNVVVLSVDDDAVPTQSSTVVPFRAAPDRRAPRVNMVVPRDGATGQALTTRVGLTFDEFVDVHTVWRGSLQVREAGSTAPLDGHYSGQEGAVNFWPARPLRPSTRYEVVVPAGGVRDYSGNAVATEFRASFTTAPCGGQ